MGAQAWERALCLSKGSFQVIAVAHTKEKGPCSVQPAGAAKHESRGSSYQVHLRNIAGRTVAHMSLSFKVRCLSGLNFSCAAGLHTLHAAKVVLQAWGGMQVWGGESGEACQLGKAFQQQRLKIALPTVHSVRWAPTSALALEGATAAAGRIALRVAAGTVCKAAIFALELAGAVTVKTACEVPTLALAQAGAAKVQGRLHWSGSTHLDTCTDIGSGDGVGSRGCRAHRVGSGSWGGSCPVGSSNRGCWPCGTAFRTSGTRAQLLAMALRFEQAPTNAAVGCSRGCPVGSSNCGCRPFVALRFERAEHKCGCEQWHCILNKRPVQLMAVAAAIAAVGLFWHCISNKRNTSAAVGFGSGCPWQQQLRLSVFCGTAFQTSRTHVRL
eukprot:614645-Pelagomonas_calceolata.AAC.5